MIRRRDAAAILAMVALTALALPLRAAEPGAAAAAPPFGTLLAPGDIEVSAHQLTQRMVFELRPAADARNLRMRVDAHLSAGRVHWLLTDPTGKTVFDAHGDGRHVAADSGSIACDPTCEVSGGTRPGEWRLTLTLDDATGSCRIRYQGLEPVPAAASPERPGT